MPGHVFHVLTIKTSRGNGIYAGHDFSAIKTVKPDAFKGAGATSTTDRDGVAAMIRNIASLGFGERYQRESMERFLETGRIENFYATYELVTP